jgi:hypothetical protein
MSYLVAINGAFSHKVPEGNVEWDDTHLCPASKLTLEEATQFSVYPLTIATPPTFDPTLVNGVWTQTWAVTALDAPTIASNQAQADVTRIASLWQAAHDLEYAAISGSAIGLITMGVLGGKPKYTAVEGWIKSIWVSYYERKAGTSTDCDFATVAGPCPHSVPELMVELSV